MTPKQKAIKLHQEIYSILGYDIKHSDGFNRAIYILAEYISHKVSEEVIEEIIEHTEDTPNKIERLNYWEKVHKQLDKL